MFYIRWLQTSKATLNPETPPASLPFFLLSLQALLSLHPANCFGAKSDCRMIKNQGTCGRWYHLCLGNSLTAASAPQLCRGRASEKDSQRGQPAAYAATEGSWEGPIPHHPAALRDRGGLPRGPRASPGQVPTFITDKETKAPRSEFEVPQH